jgi:hypothetical protein
LVHQDLRVFKAKTVSPASKVFPDFPVNKVIRVNVVYLVTSAPSSDLQDL